MLENEGFLKNIPIFSSLESKVLTEITNLGSKKSFNKDSVILFQNQSDAALLIVISGKLKLTKISSEGNEVTLDFLREKDFWGETAILDGKPPAVNIVAAENSEIFIITRTDLMNLFIRKPEYSIAILNELTKQLRAYSLKIKSLSLKATEGKVASVLVQLVDEYGVVKEGTIAIEQLPTQQELADMAGTSRETILRTIHSFSKKGLIEIEGQKLRIKNYDKFKELSH